MKKLFALAAALLLFVGVSASAAFAMEVAEAFRIKVGYDYGLIDLNTSDQVKEKENVVNFSVAYMF